MSMDCFQVCDHKPGLDPEHALWVQQKAGPAGWRWVFFPKSAEVGVMQEALLLA